MNWKKWNFGFTYLPSTFTGEGYAEERLDDGSSKFGLDIELKGPYIGVNAVF